MDQFSHYTSIDIDACTIENLDHPILQTLSDELSSPIKNIQTHLKYLKKYAVFSNISILNETFYFCEESIETILLFVANIDFLKMAGSLFKKIKPKSVSTRVLIKQVIKELKDQNINTSRINIKNSADHSIVSLDQYLFRIILYNLLSNALKFSKLDIELSVQSFNNKLEITVRDQGIGIPDNQIPEVFKPFVRVANCKMINGVGIGLAMVAKAVKLLNGIVTVRSEVDLGSEFHIEIPIATKLTDLIRNPEYHTLMTTVSETKGNIVTDQKNPRQSNHYDFLDPGYSLIIRNITHELRTPVGILHSNIQILRMFSFNVDQHSKDESIGLCEESLKELDRFIANMDQLIRNSTQ